MYIREAHPSDSNWADPSVDLKDPTTLEERQGAARKCSAGLKLELPTVVDDLGDTVNMKYVAWPERIYIIGTDGFINYRTETGPFGFKPGEAMKALQKLLDER